MGAPEQIAARLPVDTGTILQMSAGQAVDDLEVAKYRKAVANPIAPANTVRGHDQASLMDAQDPELSDDDSLRRCLKGQTDAYRGLVERYEAPLLAWLRGRLGDCSAAQEVAQEAFVRAWFELGRFRRGDAFFPWLCGIAQQVTREMLRARRRREHHQQAAGLERSVALEATTETDEPDLALRAAIDALPANLREIVLLRYYGECSCKEVGRRLNLPLGTVTKSLSRAHGLLRERLRPDPEVRR